MARYKAIPKGGCPRVRHGEVPQCELDQTRQLVEVWHRPIHLDSVNGTETTNRISRMRDTGTGTPLYSAIQKDIFKGELLSECPCGHGCHIYANYESSLDRGIVHEDQIRDAEEMGLERPDEFFDPMRPDYDPDTPGIVPSIPDDDEAEFEEGDHEFAGSTLSTPAVGDYDFSQSLSADDDSFDSFDRFESDYDDLDDDDDDDFFDDDIGSFL